METESSPITICSISGSWISVIVKLFNAVVNFCWRHDENERIISIKKSIFLFTFGIEKGEYRIVIIFHRTHQICHLFSELFLQNVTFGQVKALHPPNRFRREEIADKRLVCRANKFIEWDREKTRSRIEDNGFILRLCVQYAVVMTII